MSTVVDEFRFRVVFDVSEDLFTVLSDEAKSQDIKVNELVRDTLRKHFQEELITNIIIRQLDDIDLGGC